MDSGAEEEDHQKNPMNQNLDQLRQNYCRPGVATTKGVNSLFPLEKECDQGRSILASAPKTFLQFQEFSPYGLQQTYRDEATDLELPVFVVFNLEGNHQLSFEITTDSIAPTAEPKSLPSYIPFQKTQASVREINKRRDRGERAAGRVSLILGIVPSAGLFFFRTRPFSCLYGSRYPDRRMAPRLFPDLRVLPLRAESAFALEETDSDRGI